MKREGLKINKQGDDEITQTVRFLEKAIKTNDIKEIQSANEKLLSNIKKQQVFIGRKIK